MTQSAVAYRETDTGNTSLSTGLRTHKGIMEATTLRIKGPPLWPHDGAGGGQGLELAHYTDNYSVIQAYNRETSQWLGLVLNAGYITLAPQGSGKVNLPAGTAQALIGQWNAAVNWTCPQINVWTETPVTANFTSNGVSPWRMEYAVAISNPAKGAVIYIGLGLDGAVTWQSLALIHVPEANYIETVSGVMYHTTPPGAGPHRVSVWMHTNSAGSTINPGAYATLWVTEQRA